MRSKAPVDSVACEPVQQKTRSGAGVVREVLLEFGVGEAVKKKHLNGIKVGS